MILNFKLLYKRRGVAAGDQHGLFRNSDSSQKAALLNFSCGGGARGRFEHKTAGKISSRNSVL